MPAPTPGSATSSPQAHAALRLLARTAPKLAEDFSGLGVVFYDSLAELPFLALDVGGQEQIDLPIAGLDPVSDVLARTARRSSPWHDGFHLVHADPCRLTHLCQFIAPPLPGAGVVVGYASGARNMTALLASKVSGIVAVGVLTQERVATIYVSGTLGMSEPLA